MKQLVSLLLPALLLTACSAPPLSPRPEGQGFETRLAVRDSGLPNGEVSATNPTLVLLHGWCCDQSFFDDLRPALEAEHRVVSFDFPGHGETLGRTEEATLEALAQETADLLERSNLTDVVLIGHSMGAPVALLTADLAEARVRGLIAIDALHDLGKSIDRSQLEGLI
ncbi:MAG: alpha/beta hydrolase, partial [Planctomycetota bacterium]